MTRKATDILITMMEEGTLTADAHACLIYMSEDDVLKMAWCEGFIEEEEEE